MSFIFSLSLYARLLRSHDDSIRTSRDPRWWYDHIFRTRMALVQSYDSHRTYLDQALPYAEEDASSKPVHDHDRIPDFYGIHRDAYRHHILDIRHTEWSLSYACHAFHREDVYGIRIYQGPRALVLRREIILARTYKRRVLPRRDSRSLCTSCEFSLKSFAKILWMQK